MTAAPRILIVDDDLVNLTSTSQRLARRGFVVEATSRGEDALTRVKTGAPDVVLLDIMMPGISGLEVLKAIRASHTQMELPVIMVTAKESVDDITGALQLGANDYIAKPIHMDVAVARIETQIAIRRLHRESLAKKELEAVHAMIVTYNHEINNPLAAALANLDMAAKTGETQFLGKARSGLLRVAEIVRRIAAIEQRGITYESYVNNTKMVCIK